MKVLDLFSGIGGFALGFSNAGYEIGGFCEIETHCIRVLNKNFPDIPVFTDIKSLEVKKGDYDIFTGGFPCQDISIAGKNAGINGQKSGLWKEYLRLIKNGEPKYAIIENVSALLGRGLEVILQDLAEIGYDATWTTYDSKYFGVPQRRRRVYIVAVRDGIKANTELFEFSGRDSRTNKDRMEHFEKSFKWDFEKGARVREGFTFLTRQRSDEFKEIGLSSTLAKRDYKSYVDLVIAGGNARRVTPDERLRLQGFPSHWFDGCGLSNTEKFTCNGMTVNVVEYIAKRLRIFDVINSKPDGAEFYSDGHYRVADDSDRGSSIIINGVRHPSAFSVNWLKSRSDYVKFTK